jgi:SAM-dependent methyltransferase
VLLGGSIPADYKSNLVPLMFEPGARERARRVAAIAPARVLEIAAGTGVVTRMLDAALAPSAAIVATDLNRPMVEHAASLGASARVEWKTADAMSLPFEDASFDAVGCQFGAMFFPDRPAAYREARRVLRPGGSFVFDVWDRIEENEVTEAVEDGVATLFPAAPPRFLRRIPHGYHDRAAIERDVVAAGFSAPAIETLSLRSVAASPRIPAVAFCHGSPLRNEIEALGAPGVAAATDAAEARVAERFGRGVVDTKMQAHVVTVRK